MSAFALIEGPSDVTKAWFESHWTRIQCHASRLQTRIVKVLNHRVLHGALPRLEPCAGKFARPVLRGLGGGNVTRLPDSAKPDPKPFASLNACGIFRFIAFWKGPGRVLVGLPYPLGLYE